MYRIERQDQLYKTLPQALFFSPTIVIFSVLTLLLPLSGVFTPGSLAVTKNSFSHVGPCMIPSGNLSASDTPDFAFRRRPSRAVVLCLAKGFGTHPAMVRRLAHSRLASSVRA
jgi:hypothetical protein